MFFANFWHSQNRLETSGLMADIPIQRQTRPDDHQKSVHRRRPALLDHKAHPRLHEIKSKQSCLLVTIQQVNCRRFLEFIHEWVRWSTKATDQKVDALDDTWISLRLDKQGLSWDKQRWFSVRVGTFGEGHCRLFTLRSLQARSRYHKLLSGWHNAVSSHWSLRVLPRVAAVLLLVRPARNFSYWRQGTWQRSFVDSIAKWRYFNHVGRKSIVLSCCSESIQRFQFDLERWRRRKQMLGPTARRSSRLFETIEVGYFQ